MCRAVRCRECGKTTWTGCGMHIDEVKRGVRPEQWCGGHTPAGVAGSTGAGSSGAAGSRWNMFRRKG
nr:hypothetical protein [Skermania piniformis]